MYCQILGWTVHALLDHDIDSSCTVSHGMDSTCAVSSWDGQFIYCQITYHISAHIKVHGLSISDHGFGS